MSPSRPQPDPERLAYDFAPQFEYAERVLEAVWWERPENHELANRYAFTLGAILCRSMSTYRGVLTLLRAGLVDQSWMLNRSLFEDLVGACWLALPDKRDEALDLIAKQGDRLALLWDDRGEKHQLRLGIAADRDPELDALGVRVGARLLRRRHELHRARSRRKRRGRRLAGVGGGRGAPGPYPEVAARNYARDLGLVTKGVEDSL